MYKKTLSVLNKSFLVYKVFSDIVPCNEKVWTRKKNGSDVNLRIETILVLIRWLMKGRNSYDILFSKPLRLLERVSRQRMEKLRLRKSDVLMNKKSKYKTDKVLSEVNSFLPLPLYFEITSVIVE